MFRDKKIIAAALFFFSCGYYFSQSAPVQLEHLLRSLEKKFGTVFSYDADLIKDVPVSLDTSGSDLNRILKSLTENTAFTFQITDKKNVLLKPKSPNGNFVLCGSVIDRRSKEPLIGALILQTHSEFFVSADESGSFYKIIKYNPADSISINTTGYHSVTVPVTAFTNGCAAISLENLFYVIKEVSVTAYMTQGISYDALDNSITIRPRNLSILPGQTNGDVLQSLDALPGISTPDTKAGNLNIRGSTPDQTMITFDNIPIYHKGHYFGTLSPFNSRTVENIKVTRSAMSANTGGRVGGIIEIGSSNSVTNKPQGNISSSLLDAAVYVHTPLVKNKLSFLVSARHSYPYSWNSPALAPLSEYVFQLTEIQPLLDSMPGHRLNSLTFYYRDVNAKLIASLSQKHKASVSFLYLENRMTVSSQVDKQPLTFDTAHFNNWGVNAMINSKWNSKFSSALSITNSFYRQDFSNTKVPYGNPAIISYFNNHAGDFRVLAETDWSINQKYALRSGYDLRRHDMEGIRDGNDTGKNSQPPIRIVGKGYIHTAYSGLIASPFKKFLLNGGVRMNYYDVERSFSIEPRLSISYKLDTAWRLKASAGYQKQFVTQISGVGVESIGGIENPLWLLADPAKNLPVVNSIQTTFGAMFEKKSWLIDVEAYYKDISNVSFVSITQPKVPNPFINGTINTIGADLLVRKQWKKLDAWVSYTASKSMMQFDSVQRDPFISLYDQTHVLDLAAAYKIKQWKFSAAWKFRTGLAVLPGIRLPMLHGVSTTPSQNPQQGGGGQPLPGPVKIIGETQYSSRFPNYHQLDISAAFNFPKEPEKWNGSIGVSGLNVYNRQNIIGQIVEKKGAFIEVRHKYGILFMPNITASFSW